MNPLVAVLLAAMASVPSVVEQDGVRVEVFIRSQQYAWRVHNDGTDPITGFRVEQHNCYTQLGPPGWQVEPLEGTSTMVAEAPEERLAIGPGQYGDFRATVSSNGATLGVVPMTLTTASGNTISLEVRGPVPMPRRAVLTVALTLCAVAFLHARIVGRRTGKS